LLVKSDYGFTTVRGMKYTSQVRNTSVTKQWMTKWPFIGNDVFRIVHNHADERGANARFDPGADPEG